MAKSGHGLPKAWPGPAMPYLFTPCRWATPEMVLQPFQGWSAHRAAACSCLLPPWTPHAVRLCQVLNIPSRTEGLWVYILVVWNHHGLKWRQFTRKLDDSEFSNLQTTCGQATLLWPEGGGWPLVGCRLWMGHGHGHGRGYARSLTLITDPIFRKTAS
jgi:hypothetical protein